MLACSRRQLHITPIATEKAVPVLLTNDDGADAEGILAIRAALADCCDKVITIAP